MERYFLSFAAEKRLMNSRFLYGELLEGSASIRMGLVNQLWRNNPVVIKKVMSNQLLPGGRLIFPVHISNVVRKNFCSFH